MCCLDKCDDGVFHFAWWQYVAWREYVGWYLRTWSPAEWEDLASTLMYAHADRPFIRTTKNVEWPYDEIPAIWIPLPLFVQCHLSIQTQFLWNVKHANGDILIQQHTTTKVFTSSHWSLSFSVIFSLCEIVSVVPTGGEKIQTWMLTSWNEKKMTFDSWYLEVNVFVLEANDVISPCWQIL